MTRDKFARALRLIDRRDPRCFDVAAEYGQMFDNVKHMAWFVRAVAEAL